MKCRKLMGRTQGSTTEDRQNEMFLRRGESDCRRNERGLVISLIVGELKEGLVIKEGYAVEIDGRD